MTPEETQRTMEFIVASQANSVVRMDRVEANLSRLEVNLSRLEVNLSRLEEDLGEMKEQQRNQKETLDVLVQVTQELVKVSTSVVERVKRLESRSDSVDETLKVLRELLEANLRRPDNPRQEN